MNLTDTSGFTSIMEATDVVTQIDDRLADWRTYQILTSLTAFLSLYIAVTQISYCFLVLPKKTNAKRSKFDEVQTSHSRPGPQGQFFCTLNVMVTVAAVFAFMRCGFDFCWVMERFTDLACELSIKFKKSCYAVSMLFIYLSLWLRQRVFYQHPLLHHLSSRAVRFISWSVSVLLVTGIVFLGVFYMVTATYVGTPRGCTVVKNPLTIVRWYLLVFILVPFQISLLALYSYPLIKHRLVAMGPTGKANHVIPMIRRAALAAAFCSVSDIAFATVFLVYESDVMTLTTYLYDINIVINLLGLIFSFQNWQTRLMPWRIKKNEDLDSATESKVETTLTQV
uniref:uncharacterized protein LOC120339090 n=1 Tax=Styela clava TaxID=7725 RepID=UPI00193A2ADB|nr:uncharacterized protein LOC120339090 [Styela clava]